MDQLLRVAAVLDIVGVSRSALYEWMKEGRFPRPILISRRALSSRNRRAQGVLRWRMIRWGPPA